MAQARHSDCANLMLMSNASSNSSILNNAKNNTKKQEPRTSARQKSKNTNSTFDGRSPETNTIKTMQ